MSELSCWSLWLVEEAARMLWAVRIASGNYAGRLQDWEDAPDSLREEVREELAEVLPMVVGEITGRIRAEHRSGRDIFALLDRIDAEMGVQR